MSGFSLPDGCTIDGDVMRRNVLDLDADDVTAPELAVDGEIEHGEVTCSPLDLQLRADRPDMLGSQWRLGADQFSLIPRRPARMLSKLYIWIFHGQPPLTRRSTIMLRLPWLGEIHGCFQTIPAVPRQSMLTDQPKFLIRVEFPIRAIAEVRPTRAWSVREQPALIAPLAPCSCLLPIM